MTLSYTEIKDMADKEMWFDYKFTAQLLRSSTGDSNQGSGSAATVIILAAHGVVEAVAFGGTGINRELLIE